MFKKKKKMRERERVINAFSKAVPSLLPQQSVNEDSCFCVSSSLFVSIFSTKIFCWKSQKATFSSSSPRVWFLRLSVVGKRQRISVHNLFLSLSLSFCLLNNSAFFFYWALEEGGENDEKSRIWDGSLRGSSIHVYAISMWVLILFMNLSFKAKRVMTSTDWYISSHKVWFFFLADSNQISLVLEQSCCLLWELGHRKFAPFLLRVYSLQIRFLLREYFSL